MGEGGICNLVYYTREENIDMVYNRNVKMGGGGGCGMEWRIDDSETQMWEQKFLKTKCLTINNEEAYKIASDLSALHKK